MGQGRHTDFDVRVRAVNAVKRGLPIGQVADTFGVDRTTLFRWLQRFRENGQDGLQRQTGSGRPRLLGDLAEADLRRLILFPASDFGYETDLWTVGRVKHVIEDLYGVRISKNTIWRRLQIAGLTYQKPERQYFEADDTARREWLRTVVPQIRQAVRKFRAILYFQDESNVSLTAFLGKTWGICGKTPRVPVNEGAYRRCRP
jgi:transposase